MIKFVGGYLPSVQSYIKIMIIILHYTVVDLIKHYMIIIYDCKVVLTRKLPILRL